MTANPGPDDEALDGAPGETAGRPDPLLADIQAKWRAAHDHWHDALAEMQEDYDFVANHQWSEDDLQILRDSLRPVITFNRIGPFIDSVSGLEIQNRQETRFIPRTLGKSGVSELLTAAGKWIRDETYAEDEESDAFIDLVVCGIGWTQTNLSYDEDPAGMVQISRTDPREMLVDPASRKRNFADASYIIRSKDVPIEQARDAFPGFDDTELHAGWAQDLEFDTETIPDRQEASFYRSDQGGQLDRQRKKVRMVEIEWWEFEQGYRVYDSLTQSEQKLDAEGHDRLQKRAAQLNRINPAFPAKFESVKYRRKRYHRAVCGAVVLHEADGPEQGGFTYKAMTGHRDAKFGTFYGLVRAMKDPQRWANKWLSQTLHIINTNAKGGIIVEDGVFENPREAADQWADPSAIIAVTSGSIQQARIMPRPIAPFPQGINELMQFAIASIPGVTGVSPEMMGQVDRTQPGVLEMQRKQQGMAILAGFFDALRRYRKEQGRLMLWMIQQFISDGRLIRIGGPEDAQYAPLVRDKTLGEYDVVVDDTPSSPNMKERVWGALLQMFPMLSRLPLPPTVWLKMMEFSPLPTSLIADVTKDVQQQMQQQQGGQALQAAEVQVKQAHAEALHAQAMHNAAKAQQSAALAQGDTSYKQAQIESLRAGAAANLAKAGVDTQESKMDRMLNMLDLLLRGHQQAHDQRMDMIGAQQQAQQAQDQRDQFATQQAQPAPA